jgi:hypothetical protein
MRKEKTSLGRKHLGFNEYEIRGDITAILVENKHGEKFETIIDTEDLQKLIGLDLRWRIRYDLCTKSNYVWAAGNKKRGDKPVLYLHMVVMNFEFDNFKFFIDHEDHDGLNNRKLNLRIVTMKENSRHRKSRNVNNSSGYRNVSHDKDGNPIVQLQDENGKNHIWRGFKDFNEAGAFAAKMRQEWYGEFSGED